MKTAGQILKEARLDKLLTPAQLSSITRIDQKYIEALEKDQYHLLPSETVAKGFIRNLSVRLDKNPNDLVAIFRRDYRHPQPNKTTKNIHKRHTPLVHFPSHLIVVALSVIVFTGYLLFQFRAVIKPPSLEIVRPASGSVLTSPFEVEGISEPGVRISIADEVYAKADTSGHFIVRMSHAVGELNLKIEATNRFGRTSEEKIPLTIISQ